jgi:hypothetical protein
VWKLDQLSRSVKFAACRSSESARESVVQHLRSWCLSPKG